MAGVWQGCAMDVWLRSVADVWERGVAGVRLIVGKCMLALRGLGSTDGAQSALPNGVHHTHLVQVPV